ncbi:hypothetical protein KAR91_26075 [Candidatus Pacearchaeota archaeon]|nr:hypothetical protein [Candidatus Pacearchaeota archaeon]
MTMYSIEGKNAAGNKGTWDIEASDKDAAEKIIKARGITAEKVNGETVKKGKAQNSKGD